MLENATRICEAKFGTMFRFDGKAFHWAAGIGTPPALAELQKRRGPYLPDSANAVGSHVTKSGRGSQRRLMWQSQTQGMRQGLVVPDPLLLCRCSRTKSW